VRAIQFLLGHDEQLRPQAGASDVVALSVRHPELLISWLPCGHDIGQEMPAELAHLVRAFARLARPG
jgi:hypothetical protein